MDYYKKRAAELIFLKKSRNVWRLKDNYKDDDIYIIGSGPSLDYVSKQFFYNKNTIGINDAYKYFNCDYSLSVHKETIQKQIKDGQRVIASFRDRQIGEMIKDVGQDNYVFNHRKYYNYDKLFLDDLDKENYLIPGRSSVIPAIHAAYVMGAKNIILCGIDCGTLDGSKNVKNYNEGKSDYSNDFFNLVSGQIKELAMEIRKRGVSVMSLNPFINFGLEGHIYSR